MRAPIFIEFAGLPAAGKTTMASTLRSVLREAGWTVDLVAEPGLACPLKRIKRHWAFNAWTLSRTIATILEKCESGSSIVVLDRGLVDALAWIRWFTLRGELRAEDAAVASRFAMSDEWFPLQRIVFVLFARFEVACRRRRQVLPGRIVNPATMSQLEDAYRGLVQNLVGSAKPVCAIDTSDLAREEVLKVVLDALPIKSWRDLQPKQEISSIPLGPADGESGVASSSQVSPTCRSDPDTAPAP